jgi:AhpD family alkylhydroperoxidase
MKTTATLQYERHMPEVLQSFVSTQATIRAAGLEPGLSHLVHLRASQINGCAFCVKMHTREAREAGETNERLDRLVVWEHVSDYTPRERAALAWTEALTRLEPRTDYAALRADLLEHFSEREASALTADVAMINLWNRIAISRH